jgi:nucleotide-binding universal stress UspA family protein
MFRRILVASDLSPAAEQIINMIYSFHVLGTEEIVLVHCLDIRDAGLLSETLIPLLQPEVDREVAKLNQLGFVTTGEIRIGSPGLEINRVARERDCSIIVIGSHGYSMDQNTSLGGVATTILHTATRPVLVVKITSPPSEISWNPLNHILYPTDFSDNAKVAFTYLETLVRCGAEKVTLLHVQDKIIGKHLVDRLAEFNKIDETLLLELRDQLVNEGDVEVNIEIPFGLVAQEIINRIKTDEVSLVVMGTQGRGYIGEVFLGSVSNKVVRYSPVPVLLVPLVK